MTPEEKKLLQRVFNVALARRNETKWKRIWYAIAYGARWRDIIRWRFK